MRSVAVLLVFLSVLNPVIDATSTAAISTVSETTTTTGIQVTTTGKDADRSTSSTTTTTTLSTNTTTTTLTTTTSLVTTTSIVEIPRNTTIDDFDRPSAGSSRSPWMTFLSLVVLSAVVIGFTFTFYYRQQTPYRRFLRHWHAHDDDTDDIILQLERPEATNHWPPRISFT